jgi:transposase
MIKLSDDEITILGRPNFLCAQITKVLIECGVYEKGTDSAEYEQAVYIHWASNLLKEHGVNWRKVANKILKEKVEFQIKAIKVNK